MIETNERVTVDFDSQSYYFDGEYWESWDNYGEEMAGKINELLNELQEENENITLLAQHNYEENKRIINRYVDKIKELKNDEEQLSISFLGYKLKLKKILQKRYNYADEQCQKNLNNPIIHRVYDIIRYDVKKLAEEMGVDLK